MSGTRANMIKAKGIVTHGSELTRSEGSQRQATNVNIDEDGVITPRRGFNDYSGATTGSASTTAIVSQIMEYKEAILRQYQDKLEYEDESGDFQDINGDYAVLREGYRTKWQGANSNFYFTSDEGIKKISVKNRADLNADMITNAGGIKAGYADGIIVPSVGGFLPPESKVGYRVLFGTKDANNNLIQGSPSSRFVVTNFNADINTAETSTVQIIAYASIGVSDYFTYTNSTGKYVVYFDTTGSDPEPQTGDTIGGIYVKADITAAINDDITAAIVANAMSVIPNSTITVATDTVSIVTTEEGDITGIGDPKTKNGGDASARFDTATSVGGDTDTGISATVQVTGTVPSGITTDYFYQVYRTGTISVSVGLEISDLDPGDEMNIVYEAGLTDAEITAGEFVFVDTTPESFRADAAPLYTNNTTGEGILQSNEAPPIALDIELFRNYMFYANTKERHRLEYSIVSVDNFISGATRFIVGNSDTTRYYTFVGAAQVTDLTIDATIPLGGDYFNAYSANDERQYYIWFDDGTVPSEDPEVSGAVGYRIDISDTPSNTVIATRIETALIDNVDFSLSVASNVITFTHTNNGYTTGITEGVDTSSSITIAVPSTDGTGELAGTDEGGDVLLSGLISAGQSIDETARSLVKIIGKDPDSPVNAYYLSASDDLPGNILLEARSLEDKTFYVSIDSEYDAYNAGTAYVKFDVVQYENNHYEALGATTGNLPTNTTFWKPFSIGAEFSPEIPRSRIIEEFTGTGTTRNIKLTDHGYSTGDLTYVGYFKDPDNPSDPNSFSGVFSITLDGVDNFDITVSEDDTFIAFPTPAFSTIFSPDVESDNKELPNRIYYSKTSQPEAVPVVNFIDVGSQDAEIKRILALRDNLFVFKDDGIYVVSGTSAPDWSVRLIDSTRIIAPDSAVVLNNQIYCLTEQGVTRVSGSGAAIISRGIENQIDSITNQQFDFSSNTFGVAYENDRAYIMFAPTDSTDTSSTQAFRYNIFEQTWSKWEYDATCGHVLSRDNKLYVGNADRNYISQERKNNDRTDLSDRNFSATINPNGVSGQVVELSTIVNVSSNDVIVQQQDVSINYINNRILRKMDFFDSGIPTAMFDTYKATTGDHLPDVMEAINDHLVTLDGVNITAKSFTFANIRANTELLVTELNTTATITAIKTYKNPETVYFEAYIASIDVLRNQVTVHTERPFIEGSLEVYKGYTCTVEWNPQHFGDPSALKQIRYVTIMFDQNNFYKATAKFASDAAQAVTEIEFNGKGIGYWGDMGWGDPNHYWGGVGNDIPFRNPVPRGKQKCRYLSLTFEHKNARENFRIVGISAVVRAISDRGYR